jgi:hypothetical protein
MAFNDLINRYKSILFEQDRESQNAAVPQTSQAAEAQPTAIPPEGYVDMVRMLAKALVMNIPAGSIDALFSTPITKENANNIREGLQDAIKSSENYEDNPQRIINPNFKTFVGSINENNFMAKYKEILNIMKRYSNDIVT